MKTICLFIAVFMGFFSASAQDLIIFRDAEKGEIQAKVKAVKNHVITYIPLGQAAQKPIKIPKHKIELIIYEDGMKQYFAAQNYQPDTLVFSSPESNLKSLSDLSPRDHYLRGRDDGRTYYKGNGPFWGTMIPTAIPVYGVLTGFISGAIIAAVPPNVDPYRLPDPQLYLQNGDYASGYETQIKRKKLGKVLAGYGVGIAVQTLIIVIIVNSY